MIKKIVQNHLRRSPRANRWFIGKLMDYHTYAHHKIAELASMLEGGIHPKHRITQYHQFFIDNVNHNDVVLDVGCGIGYLAHSVAVKAKKVTGIDFSKPNIAYAREHFRRDNLSFILGDVTQHTFAERPTKIILSNVLEHIDDRIGLLRSLAVIGDTMLFRVPMEDRDWLTIYKKEHGHEYRLDITHRIEFRLGTVTDELKRGGWRIEKYQVNWGEFWAVLKKDI